MTDDHEEYKNKTLAQTCVWHGDKAFLVSTINRASSACLAYGKTYAETLVWEWLPDVWERGDLIGQDEAGTDSLFAHQRMVERLFKTGLCETPEEESP